MSAAGPLPQRRPEIAFFEYADVFEDFYPHYGVSQREFATRWHGSGNHAFLRLLQREVGNVTWYEFSLAPELDEAVHEWIGCIVRIVSSSSLHRALWRLFYLPKHAWRWRRLYPAFAVLASYLATLSKPFLRRMQQDRPDVLFVQDYANGRFDVLMLLAHLWKIPLVAYHAGSRPEIYVGAPLKRWTIRRADRLIVSSEREREMLAADFGVAPERSTVVLTPIDTEAFQPMPRETACRIAGLDPSRRYLLFVGRLDDSVKRIGLLIDCFSKMAARFPDAELIIVGDGNDRDKLRAKAAQGDAASIRLLGWVDDAAQLAALYSAAECLVLVSRSEGFPTVIGEAMACGTPVIATDVGAIAELVVPEQTGWLLAPQPDALLAERLRETLSHILDDRTLVAPYRERARKMAERHVSPAAIALRLRECFQFSRS